MAKIGINISTGSLQQEDIIVGIDLGTTNSLVAIIHPENQKPVALKEQDSSSLVPSVLHFDQAGVITVGADARQYLLTDPANTIFSVKRLLGKTYKDVDALASVLSYNIIDDDTDSLVKVRVGDTFYSPIELSSFILRELKTRAEHILKTPVRSAVITVPAYFNDTQRQATRDAGKLAGLDVLRIINEPTAASLAYGMGLSVTEEKTIAVYDLGGGTFDISILHISNGIFEVLSTNGDTQLGGDDIDRLIVDFWLTQTGFDKSRWNAQPEYAQAFRLKAEEAKKALGTQDSFTATIAEVNVTLTRSDFEKLLQPMLTSTIKCCEQALRDAGLNVSQINEVVMVGGSTRIPKIKAEVGRFFNRQVHDDINPDEVVALGAAIQADILSGRNKDVLLLDITPLSLGVETMGGLMDVLIPRNSKIPNKASRQYTTQKDGQSSMRISVFQGERDMVEHNRKLASFNLTGIPGMPAGLPKVEISFLINADGILSVKAQELRSGVSQHIEVRPQYGLTDQEVENMLMSSLQHAKEDMTTRAVVEAKTEAHQLIDTTERFIDKNKEYLEENEITATRQAIADLQAVMTGMDKNLIQQKTADLNELSRPYAERLMDQAIGQAMRGKKI